LPKIHNSKPSVQQGEQIMSRILRAVFLAFLTVSLASAQSGAKKPIEGVWKVTETVVTGANASNNASAQPSLIIFAQQHYSMMYVPGSKPRALYKAQEPTNDEKIAAFDSLVANTGTYEISGSTLTIHPIVARNPNFMAGGFDKYQFRIDGTTLTLTEKSTDLNVRIGNRVVPESGPASETRFKLVRVE
jgi:Lipocalin-like domain